MIRIQTLKNEIPDSTAYYHSFRALKKKQALEVVSLLEYRLERGSSRQDPWLYYYLSIAYLYMGKIAQAASLITKSERLYSDFKPMKELLAYIALKSGSDKESALVSMYRYYQESSSRRILSLIKGLKRTSDFESFQRRVKISRCVHIAKPAGTGGFKLAGKTVPRTFAVSLIALAALTTVIYLIFLSGLMPGNGGGTYIVPEETISQFRIDGSRYPLVDTAETSKRFTYGEEKELLDDYERARSYIQKGELNSGVRLLNKILMSNANMSVKDRSIFLKDFISKLDKKKYETIKYETLKSDPPLYAGSFVEFDGKAANVSFDKQGNGVFTLLINEDKDRFDGTIEVIIDGLSDEDISDGSRVMVQGEFLKSEDNSSVVLIRGEHIKTM